MKTIKPILIVSFLFISSVLFAQPPNGQKGKQQGPPPVPNNEQIKEMVNHLAKEISLTEEQKESILKLHIEHFKTVKEKTSGSTRPKKEEMEALRNDFEKKIKAQLTDDQKVKYDTFLKKNNPHHQKK